MLPSPSSSTSYVCAGVSFIVFVLAILFITETNPRIVKQNKLKEEQKVLRKKVSLSMARPALLIS